MTAPRYRAPPEGETIVADLDAFVAVFHRRSGITHLLASPAPEILTMLGAEALTIDALLERLGRDYALGDADRVALSARVDELVAAGLLAAA